jgi:CBS domain-containing protein
MGLQENLKNDPVSQLALREPATASADDTIRDAVGRMREKKLGCVIVVDEQRKPLGMFTESMLTQLLVHDPTVLDQPLKEHLAERWPWVKATDSISYVLEAMNLKNVRFLCVIDDDGRLAGLAGQKGLMEYVADHFPHQVMVQRIGGTPYIREREGA